MATITTTLNHDLNETNKQTKQTNKQKQSKPGDDDDEAKTGGLTTTLDVNDSDDELLRNSCGAVDADADDDDALVVDVTMLVTGCDDARFELAYAIRRRKCVCATLISCLCF